MNKSVFVVRIILGIEIYYYGCIGGILVVDSLINIDIIYEKLDLNYVREKFYVLGMKKEYFLGVFGIYVLIVRIFDYLEENIK